MTMPSSLRLKDETKKENLPSSLRPKQVKEQPQSTDKNSKSRERIAPTILKNIAEVIPQAAKGLAENFGAVGDLLSIAGYDSPTTTPQQESRLSREGKILDRMNRGEPVSFADIQEVSEGGLPDFTRFPKGEDIAGLIEDLGGPGEAKTSAGRYAHRIGKYLPFGIKQALVAGVTGQTAEELGFSPWVQLGLEIASTLGLGTKKVPISSGSPTVQKELDNIKKLGMSDQDITLARHALEDEHLLKKSSKYTTAAEEKFDQAQSNIKGNVSEIIEKSFPGLETEGAQPFLDASKVLFDDLDNLAAEITVKKPQAFNEAADKAIGKLKETLAVDKDRQVFIDLLEEAKKTASDMANSTVRGSFYTNFYRQLNRVGNWVDPSVREKAIGVVKNGIKETFDAQGPSGKNVGQKLNEANESFIKYLDAERVSDFLKRNSNDGELSFNKLSKSLDNTRNMEMLEKTLGHQEAANLKHLSDTSMSLAQFEKMMKGGAAKQALEEFGPAYAIFKAVTTGNFKAMKAYLGLEIGGHVATQMLTNPKFQNIGLKMVQAAKENKWLAVKSLANTLLSLSL